MEKLRAEDPELVNSCSAAAGLSLGEYCALVFAGALSFEDGLKVIIFIPSLAFQLCCGLGQTHGACQSACDVHKKEVPILRGLSLSPVQRLLLLPMCFPGWTPRTIHRSTMQECEYGPYPY